MRELLHCQLISSSFLSSFISNPRFFLHETHSEIVFLKEYSHMYVRKNCWQPKISLLAFSD